MRINIDNIGIVKDSYIELDGITIITGHNNSGKTTVGKAVNDLYSAVENLEYCANRDKKSFVYSGVMGVVSGIFPPHINTSGYNLGNRISAKLSEWRNSAHIMVDINQTYFFDEITDILNMIQEGNDDQICGMFKGINQSSMGDRILALKANGEVIKGIEKIDKYKSLVNDDADFMLYADKKIIRSLQKEFHDQITPIQYRDRIGSIRITEGGRTVFDVEIRKNETISNKHLYDLAANSEIENVLMIDDARVLDDLAENGMQIQSTKFWRSQIDAENYYEIIIAEDHRTRLSDKMMPTDSLYEEMNNEKSADHILDLIDEAFSEEVVLSGSKLICSETKLDVRNLAAGSKMFAIIRQLLIKGQLTDKTLMILDEPDDHLHPEWQLVLAKVLCLLNTEIGVKILLTTHSTNLVYAFEIQAKKNNSDGLIRVYDTNKENDDYMVTYEEVTDNLDKVYQKLGEPFIQLRREEYANDNTRS